jgi:hypothetical protein
VKKERKRKDSSGSSSEDEEDDRAKKKKKEKWEMLEGKFSAYRTAKVVPVPYRAQMLNQKYRYLMLNTLHNYPVPCDASIEAYFSHIVRCGTVFRIRDYLYWIPKFFIPDSGSQMFSSGILL